MFLRSLISHQRPRILYGTTIRSFSKTKPILTGTRQPKKIGRKASLTYDYSKLSKDLNPEVDPPTEGYDELVKAILANKKDIQDTIETAQKLHQSKRRVSKAKKAKKKAALDADVEADQEAGQGQEIDETAEFR